MLRVDELKSIDKAGAKHKSKAHDKEAASHDEDKVSAKSSKASKGKDADGKKIKKEKVILRDANGNELKRPLTAYLLYNNFRRPILKAEHVGKLLQ